MEPKRRPELAKTRPPALIERRGSFVRTTEGRWRDVFAQADAVSEGAVKHEGGAATWYGTTSLILELPVDIPVDEHALVRAVAEKDVHVHLHALRAAQREAQTRAPGMLGRVVCELRFEDHPGGFRIDVDVQAPLIERRSAERVGP